MLWYFHPAWLKLVIAIQTEMANAFTDDLIETPLYKLSRKMFDSIYK